MAVSTSSFRARKIQLNVRKDGLSAKTWSAWRANDLPDINSELDELDREEFYRLKKVRIELCILSMFLTRIRLQTRSRETRLQLMPKWQRRGKRPQSLPPAVLKNP